MGEHISLDDSYDAFERIEEAFGDRLDESLDPRGPADLWDVVEPIAPLRDGMAVDIGCGGGEDAIELATRFGLRVRGVDPVRHHIEVATAAAAAAGLADRVTFELGHAEQLPVPDASADLVWAKESLMYVDLDGAFAEIRRVLRPGGRCVVYQVFTGPRMSDDEAVPFWSVVGDARNVRPDDVIAAAAAVGLSVRDRTDFTSEWGEHAQEQRGAGGRRLLHAARLLRDPDRYVAEFGAASYQVMLGDCLWHVYRMIGKLTGVALVLG
jgi:SAM-dependent methyltransferase